MKRILIFKGKGGVVKQVWQRPPRLKWPRLGELMIQIKNEKRVFTLPDVLRNKTVQSAEYTEGQLSIKFA